jgi:hypothetical protein
MQYLDLQKRRSDLLDKNERAISDYRTNDSKIRECTSAFTDLQSPERQQIVQKKMMGMMSDANAISKFNMAYADAAQAYGAALQKNDSVAASKAYNDIMKLLGIDAKADSVAAAAKCGTPPRRPAALAEAEQLGKQTDDISARLRMAESSADIEAARAAGVQPARFAQMRERLTSYLSKPAAFPGKEGDLLKGRKAEIEDLTRIP